MYGTTPAAAVQGCIAFHLSALFTHMLTNIDSIVFAIRNGSYFGGINYSGEIVFLGSYNPYGKLFATQGLADAFVAARAPNQAHYASIDTGGEILPGWDAATQLLNSNEAAAAALYSVCFANPQKPSYNPLAGFNPRNGQEPGRLQSLTNMANPFISNSLFDGPDIHPKPLGYQKLALIMKASCPLAPS